MSKALARQITAGRTGGGLEHRRRHGDQAFAQAGRKSRFSTATWSCRQGGGEKIGGRALAVGCDVTDAASVKSAF